MQQILCKNLERPQNVQFFSDSQKWANKKEYSIWIWDKLWRTPEKQVPKPILKCVSWMSSVFSDHFRSSWNRTTWFVSPINLGKNGKVVMYSTADDNSISWWKTKIHKQFHKRIERNWGDRDKIHSHFNELSPNKCHIDEFTLCNWVSKFCLLWTNYKIMILTGKMDPKYKLT